MMSFKRRCWVIPVLLGCGLLQGCGAAAQDRPPLPQLVQSAFTTIDTQCSGGIAGRLVRHRLYPDGRIDIWTGIRAASKKVQAMTADQAHLLSRRLDAIGFESLKLARPPRPVPDSITCTVARVRDGKRSSVTVHAPGTPPSPEVREIAAIRRAIENAASGR